MKKYKVYNPDPKPFKVSHQAGLLDIPAKSFIIIEMEDAVKAHLNDTYSNLEISPAQPEDETIKPKAVRTPRKGKK